MNSIFCWLGKVHSIILEGFLYKFGCQVHEIESLKMTSPNMTKPCQVGETRIIHQDVTEAGGK